MKAAMNKNGFVIDIDYGRCGNCGACVAVCPEGVLHLGTLVLVADNNKCTGCKRCVIICPADALKLMDMTGSVLTVESVDAKDL